MPDGYGDPINDRVSMHALLEWLRSRRNNVLFSSRLATGEKKAYDTGAMDAFDSVIEHIEAIGQWYQEN